MSPLDAVFIVPALTEASARLRVKAALPGLGAEGVEGTCLEIPIRTSRRWGFFRDLARADVVVLHRKLLNILEFSFLRRNARRLVFDFDDAIMFRDPFRGHPKSARRSRRFSNTVSKADGIVAGNQYLKDLALEAGTSGDVRVIPTAVDVSRYGWTPPTKGKGTVLGWIGQASTLPYLQDIVPFLDDLACRTPDLTLRVVSDLFPTTNSILLDARPWTEEGEAGLLKGIDVGLMPLRDDPWSRGKCGYKILQYFAAGRPVVASPVGVNRELVRPGETGFLAVGPDQWEEGITKLLADKEGRRRMGRSGHDSLERGGFTLREYCGNLASFLRQVC
ncbi:MAG: glycosyltransferase family 4 protein [Planctomycetota bacterium]